MDYTLNEIERRVLGVLIEKAFTQTNSYPLTLNAIIAGCNQKSNRDPEMELDDEAVWSTLRQLQDRGLVTRILPAPGSRSDRFKHNVDREFNWQSPQRAVMAELMLRGPQTVGELRTRCARMTPFDDLAAVSAVLGTLGEWDPPLVAPLPREAGRSAIRYTHLLAPADEQPQVASTPIESRPAASSAMSAPVARRPIESDDDDYPEDVDGGGASAAEVEDMQIEIAELHESLAELRRRVDELERRLG